MCNAMTCNDPFHGLGDDDEFFEDFGRETPNSETPAEPVAPAPQAPAAPVFEETCPKCKGSGRFVGYTGRVIGNCFNCKGSGKLTFKTDAATRAKQADSRARTAQAKKAELEAKVVEWTKENPIEWQWMCRELTSFDFAKSMMEALIKYGYLTERQLDAVRRCISKQQAREEQRAAEKLQRETAAQVVNIQPIMDAFNKARSNGVKRPIMRFETFRFSLAPETGANAGAIYAKAKDENKTYLGKIVEGKFITSRDCTPEMEATIIATCANPAEAATAYGRTSGECSICGRELTDPVSIAAGIGPICAGNYGF